MSPSLPSGNLAPGELGQQAEPHKPSREITNGAVDRTVHTWIADECSRSTVKNSLAILTRVMEQAVRNSIIDRNPARITGWQREYQRAEDELDVPRSLALPDWEALDSHSERWWFPSCSQHWPVPGTAGCAGHGLGR